MHDNRKLKLKKTRIHTTRNAIIVNRISIQISIITKAKEFVLELNIKLNKQQISIITKTKQSFLELNIK